MEYYQELEGKVKESIEGGYEFKLKQYLEEGWDLTKKTLPTFLVLLLLFIGVSLVIGLLLFAVGSASFEGIEYWFIDNLLLVAIVGYLATIVFSPLNVGAYLIIYAEDTGKGEGIGSFFKGYKDFAQIALFSMVTGLPVLLLNLAVGFLGVPEFMGNIATLFISVFFIFSLKLIAIKKYSFLNALKASAVLAGPKSLHIILLFIVIILINILGALALILGLLVTIPYSSCIIYAFFKDVCLGEKEDLELEDNLIAE